MKENHHWPTTSIRVNPEALHQARISAVTNKKLLGQWLEEAIMEKADRDKRLGKENGK
jgi:predicted HicB family RNase H-like nuclease